MYCICCKKLNVTPMNGLRGMTLNQALESAQLTEEDLLWKKEEDRNGRIHNINNEMVQGGIIHIIEAGYGSKHDGDQFIIAICDACIKENLEDASLLYWGSYMPGHLEMMEAEIEKSKTLYRRRKNLDNLV